MSGDNTRVPTPVDDRRPVFAKTASQGNPEAEKQAHEIDAAVNPDIPPASGPGAGIAAVENAAATDEEARLAGMPTGVRLYLLMMGLFFSVFVVSLDQTIVAPAIPIISNEFGALADVGWYGSAYFATSTALQPLYGRLYRLNLKWPYVSCLVIFEIGSLICALAKDSNTFIIGRAIAGLGVAGGYIGTLTIIAASVPLNKVPVWSGGVGAVFGVGAILGPLIGGVFTSEVTWRWCFWLSLPLGGVTLICIFLFFHPPARFDNPHKSIWRLLFSLDISGTVLVLGAMITFLLAMQDGGLNREWGSSTVIGLLVGTVAIVIAFVINEWYMGMDAMIPSKVFLSRTILSSSIANFGIGASYFTAAIYLPVYFQLNGSSSIRSGVQLLPLVCGVIFSVAVAGGTMPKVGYVQPYMYGGAIFGVVGAGLFQLFKESTGQALWVGVTFLFGLGIGVCFQAPFVLSQTAGKNTVETEVGGSNVIFFQTLGGALIVAVSQSIFGNVFKNQINQLTIPGLNTQAIIAAGQTGFRELLSPEQLPPVLAASMVAIRGALIPSCVAIAITLLATPFMPWSSIKGIQAGAGGA